MTARGARLLAIGGMIILAMAAACNSRSSSTPSSSPSTPPPLEISGTVWQLVRIGDREPPLGARVTITFTQSDATGFGGCNSFGGSYHYDPATGALAFGPLRSTKMACLEQALSDLEFAFLGALGGATGATLDADGHLVISGSGAALVFGPPAGG